MTRALLLSISYKMAYRPGRALAVQFHRGCRKRSAQRAPRGPELRRVQAFASALTVARPDRLTSCSASAARREEYLPPNA